MAGLFGGGSSESSDWRSDLEDKDNIVDSREVTDSTSAAKGPPKKRRPLMGNPVGEQSGLGNYGSF